MLIVVMINILILTGLALLAIQNLVSLFVCSGIAAGCGFLMLYFLVKGTYGLRFTWLLASSLLIGYGGGSFSTIFNVGFSELYDAFSVFGIPKGWGAYALVLVFFSCATLLVAGFFESPVLLGTQVVRVGWKQERFLWFGLLVTAIAYLHGDYTFMGAVSEEGTGKASILGIITQAMATILLPLAVMGLLQTKGIRRKRFIFLVIACFVSLLPSGRRVIVYTLVVCAFAGFRLSGWNPVLTRTRKVLLGVGFVFAIALTGLFFVALRLASREVSQSANGQESISLARMIPILFRDILTDPANVVRQTSENLEERPFLLEEYLALLGRGGNTPAPMYGQDFMLGVHLSVPDLVYTYLGENKSIIRNIGTEEGLANERYGLPDADNANSLFTGGIIDFGLLGVFVYPLAVCAVYRGLYHLVDQFFNKEGQLIAILFGVYLFLQAEFEISGYVLFVRNLIMIMIVWRALYELPTFFRLSAGNLGGSEDADFSVP